jgi:hypothetical protein
MPRFRMASGLRFTLELRRVGKIVFCSAGAGHRLRLKPEKFAQCADRSVPDEAQKSGPLRGHKGKGADACCSHSRFREHPLCDATWLVTKADSNSGTCRQNLTRAASPIRQAPHFQRENAKSRALDSDGSLELRNSSAPFRRDDRAINMPIRLKDSDER